MTAVAAALGVLAGLTFAALCFAIAWALSGRILRTRCSCGHSYGAVDKFTGCCTDTVVQTHWLGGVKRTRKRVPCPCREHRPAGSEVTA